MSYDPSHRRPPPRQGRWPQATPPEAWQAYQEDDAYQGAFPGRAEDQGSYWATAAASYRSQPVYQGASGGTAGRHAALGDGYPSGQESYGYHHAGADDEGAAAGYDAPAVGFAEPQDGFDGARVGHYRTAPGYADPGDDYARPQDGYPGAWNGYQDATGGYRRAGTGYGPALAAPDADIDAASWQAEADRRREAGRRGLIVGAVTGCLAVAVAIGASTLAAAFVRPQASPISAAGRVFIDRTPAALKNAAAAHFGAHAQTVLLLGMSIMIGVLALGIGVLAGRAAGLGVTGVAALSLCGAFVVITRTGSQLSDVIPSVVGALAGVAALLWLLYASAPVPTIRHARGRAPGRAR